jgi:hypothetical protein
MAVLDPTEVETLRPAVVASVLVDNPEATSVFNLHV